MRKLLLSLIVVAALLTSFSAVAEDQSPSAVAQDPSPTGCAQIPCAGDLAKKPWSAGLLVGFSVFANSDISDTSFAMEIPFEYAFVVGPGNLVAHVSFMLHARSHVVGITIPMGARYKMQFFKFPLYFYPLFDIGPSFGIYHDNGKSDTTSYGWIRFGGGVSYMVLPFLELMFEPLGLGAIFNGDTSAFVYTFLAGAQFHW